MASGDYLKAVQALTLKLQMHNACFSFSPSSGKRVEIMNQIAHAYFMQGEYSDAIGTCKKILQIVHNHSTIAAEAHMTTMKAHFKLKHTKQSGDAFQRAKEACTWSLGPAHPFIIKLLSALADLFYEEADFESAVAFLEQSLKEAKRILGSRHNLVAVLHSKIGILLANRGDSRRATAVLTSALQHFEKYPGSSGMTLNAANMCFSLAEVLAQGGRFKEAMQYASKAMRMRIQYQEEEEPDVIECYVQVARLHENLGDGLEAVRNYEKALASLKKNTGDKDSVKKVQRLSRKVLSLEVRNQPLGMRTMLQTVMLKHPALIKGSQTQIDTMDYVMKMLYVTAPSKYLRLLLEFVSAVNGDEGRLPKIDDAQSKPSPKPSAQLACLASLAVDGDEEEGKSVQQMEEMAQRGGGEADRASDMRQVFAV